MGAPGSPVCVAAGVIETKHGLVVTSLTLCTLAVADPWTLEHEIRPLDNFGVIDADGNPRWSPGWVTPAITCPDCLGAKNARKPLLSSRP